MKQIIQRLAAAAACLLLCGTMLCTLPQQAAAADEVIFTGITGLPFANGDPFKGVDLSSVISIENSGVKFYDRSGNEQDVFVTLADAGVNTVRVRIWNDPYNSQTRENYGGGICDTDCAVRIAERCAAAGLKLLVDFHYSDFWADPGKQKAPKAWQNYTVSQKADAIYDFTYSTLNKLAAAGADIAMVQVGNETTTGMCGVMLADYNWSDAGWNDLASLFNAGARAVRAFSSKTLVALHFTNPEKTDNMLYLAKMLRQTNVDYDVFATSYYPYWHGTLGNLTNVLRSIASTYGKQVVVAETSWVRTLEDSDGFSNTIGSRDAMGSNVSYEVSPAGQYAYLHDLFTAVAAVPDGKGIGVFYWEPAWLPVGRDRSSNEKIWESKGSGWGSKAAGEYDQSAAQYYGGSCIENESLFSNDGKPLDSLYVFRTVHGSGGSGNETELGQNLLRNPGFEADGGWTDHPADWSLHSTSGGHFDVRAEDVRTGSYALHWYSETAFSGCTAGTSVTVPEAGTYRLSLWLQADASSSWTLQAQGAGGTQRVTGNGAGWAVWQQPFVELELQSGETVTLTLNVSGGAGCYGSADDAAVQRVTKNAADTTTTTTATSTTTTVTETTATTASATETTTSASEPQSPVRYGDTDCSGELELHDAVLLAKAASGLPDGALSVAGRRNADLNDDGSVNSEDLALLLKYFAGILSHPHAPKAAPVRHPRA